MTFVSQAFSLRREEDVRKGELGSQSSYIKNESDQKSHRHIMVTRWKMTRPWTHYSWSRSCAWANKETVKGDNMIVNITSLLKLTFLVYLAFLRGLQKATLCCCCFFFTQVQFSLSILRKRNLEDRLNILLFLIRRTVLVPERWGVFFSCLVFPNKNYKPWFSSSNSNSCLAFMSLLVILHVNVRLCFFHNSLKIILFFRGSCCYSCIYENLHWLFLSNVVVCFCSGCVTIVCLS